MIYSTITGANFKKMLMRAGHTRGYLSHGVKQHLQKTKLSSGAHASSLLHNDHAKIQKRDAVKIIQKLKDEHLAHGVVGTATSFVDKSMRQQKVAEENIRKQNLASRAKEMAAEHQAEVAKSTKPATHSAVAGATAPVATPHHPLPQPTPLVHHATPAVTTSTRPAPTITPGHGLHTQKPPEETIDLAID